MSFFQRGFSHSLQHAGPNLSGPNLSRLAELPTQLLKLFCRGFLFFFPSENQEFKFEKRVAKNGDR